MQASVRLDGEAGGLEIEGGLRLATIVRAEDGKSSDVSVVLDSVAAEIARRAVSGAYHTCTARAGDIVATFDVVKAAWRPEDATLALSGGEGAGKWNTARVALSFARKTPSRDVARAVASAIGLPVIGGDDAILPSIPRTFSCRWRDAMRQCFGSRWTVTASGVVVGGVTAVIDLGASFHVIDSIERQRLDDGSVQTTTVISLPATPCDVGARVSGVQGVQNGRVVRVEHAIGHERSKTTITIKS